MDDRFETTFVVSVEPEQAWSRLAAGEQPEGWWLPGFDATVAPFDVVAGRQLRARKESEPCAGTEIAITLEAAATGTKVTVVQSGFGAWFNEALDALTIGWSHIVADLMLFLERGVQGQRHARPWASLGCGLRETPIGLEVASTYPGTYAERAGLVPGDVLLSVAGAPVLVRQELEALMRVLSMGEKVAVTVARGNDRIEVVDVL